MPDQSSPQRPPIAAVDLRRADAAYKRFPSFQEWSTGHFDLARWTRYTTTLKELREKSGPSLMTRALGIVKRAAAFDTGAIEGLYETDRGFTFTVATEAVTWEASLAQKGPRVLALFESQLKAYERVVDFATQNVPIAEAWIRALHAEVCASQDTYSAWTELGPQEIALPKGEYKHLPNHVVKADGTIHSYAPVEMTGPEMFRFCEELRSESFNQAQAVLQASYAHYAFVAIHPFADGNGRVARALASVFTCRAESIPLLIFADTRKDYFDSLARADEGSYQHFIDFIFERAADALRLTEESLRTALEGSTDVSLDKLTRLYVTKGGYSQQEVDQAGDSLATLFREELQRETAEIRHPSVQVLVEQTSFGAGHARAGYRQPPSTAGIRVRLTSAPPAGAAVATNYVVEVPRDAGSGDDIVLRELTTGDMFQARMTELVPTPSSALRLRLRLKTAAVHARLLDQLVAEASKAIRGASG